MSVFAKMFGGGGKKAKAQTPQEAIQKLREVEEMLMKKTEFLEKKIQTELTTAKKNGTKNKRVSLQALKRKKRYEKQLAQIDGTLSTIEFQREALENSSTNTEVLSVMNMAAQAMKSAHDSLDVDKVHDMMDDISEQQDIATEISEAISNPVGFNADVDEDELNAELEELEQQDLDEQMLNIETPDRLPSVPTVEPVEPTPARRQAKEEEDEMRMLEAWSS